MSDRFTVADAPRPVPPGTSAETPLLSLAWRALRAEHRRQAADRVRAHDEVERLRRTLADIGSLTYRFRGGRIDDLIHRIERALADSGISILAPEGEPFTPELMQLFENIAQRPGGDGSPLVAEVVEPAILCGNELLRMGKAVIAVPAAPPEAAGRSE